MYVCMYVLPLRLLNERSQDDETTQTTNIIGLLKGQLNSSHANGHTSGFHLLIHKFEPHCRVKQTVT